MQVGLVTSQCVGGKIVPKVFGSVISNYHPFDSKVVTIGVKKLIEQDRAILVDLSFFE